MGRRETIRSIANGGAMVYHRRSNSPLTSQKGTSMAEEQKETRTLAELGPGDQVAILSGKNHLPQIDKIRDVSQGIITLGSSERYHQTTGDKYWPKGTPTKIKGAGAGPRIVPITEEILLRLKHATLVRRLQAIHWSLWEKLELATLEGIVHLIDADPYSTPQKKGEE